MSTTHALRTVHIDTGREMRGGQHQVLLLLRLLQQAGHQVTLLARARSPLYQEAQLSGLTVYASNLASVFRFSAQAEIVHAHDARGHTLAALASRNPFVVSRRVAFPVQRGMASKWKYGRAARFLAVSNFVAQQLKTAGIPAGRIDIVYDGVAETPPGCWDVNAPAVALALRDSQKGRALVEQAARIAGIGIVFSSSLDAGLQRASSFVYITQSEGLGSAALFAMQMGIPVVASRVQGLAEVFEDGVSGLYTENDPNQIARAMRRLIDSPDTARGIVTEARKRVAEQFSAHKLLERTLQSYARALHA